MTVAIVQFSPWDKIYYFELAGFKVKKGDRVIVRTDLGLEYAEVLGVKDFGPEEIVTAEGEAKEFKPIVRMATKDDAERVGRIREKADGMNFCKDLIKKYNLPMKLVDMRYSYEGNRITFAFIADGRVDFRELVKELTRHFNCVIRLQQIGIRDEAKMRGDFGHCGMGLCCGRFLNELTSITSEMAELQQCNHRGSERISGVCGRLMCCLAYEASGYKYMAEKMPPIGARVNVDGKRGIVVGHNILKQSVNVEFPVGNGEGTSVMEVDLNRHKKSKK